MCGIFGVLTNEKRNFSLAHLNSIIDELFILSESRGKEAAGIAVLTDGKIKIYKEGIIATSFIYSKSYKHFISSAFNSASRDNNNTAITNTLAVIGHTRLATNGTQTNNDNNSPMVCGDLIGVHNGIIVNDKELWEALPSLQRISTVDSESFFALLNLFLKSGLSLIESTKIVFNKIEGSASIACIVPKIDDVILATNTGSLYSCRNAKGNIYIFASESYILQRLIKRLRLEAVLGRCDISQIKPGEGRLINIHNLAERDFSLN